MSRSYYHRPSHSSVSAPIFAHSTNSTHHSHTRRSHPATTTSSTTRLYTPRARHTTAIDPVLAYNSHSGHASIEFDLTLPPTQILISNGSSRSSYAALSSRDLAHPATSPPLPYIHIRCSDMPWSIDVYPSPNSGSGIVTVGDVLYAIYRALRRRVSASDWNASSPSMQDRVRDAWLRRCKRQQSSEERNYEKNNGLRRVDWLMKNTVFRGLTPGQSNDHWVMHVGHGEKSVKFWSGT